jgi:hypothetical protein
VRVSYYKDGGSSIFVGFPHGLLYHFCITSVSRRLGNGRRCRASWRVVRFQQDVAADSRAVVGSAGRFLRPQLVRAMPKRLDEARVLAAVAANDPPASADHLDDDEWHAAQDKWLVKWSGSVLPDGPQRRLKWKDRVKEHARLVAAAARAGSEQATPGAVRLRTIAWRASVAADDPPASADHLWTMTSGARHVAGQVREVERQRALRRPSSVRMLYARQCFDGGC